MLKNQPANPFRNGDIDGGGLQPPNPHTATRGSIKKGLTSDELDLCIGLKMARVRPMT